MTHMHTHTLSYEKIKSFAMPMAMYSASLHPSKTCFVAGGEDFKLYKFDFEDGKEQGLFYFLLQCYLGLCPAKLPVWL